jgi:hypothetical protein
MTALDSILVWSLRAAFALLCVSGCLAVAAALIWLAAEGE